MTSSANGITIPSDPFLVLVSSWSMNSVRWLFSVVSDVARNS